MNGEPETRLSEDFAAARARQVAEAAAERARAAAHWQKLQAAGDLKAWKKLVLADPNLQSWALCERLCHESAALADEDSESASRLVELAQDLAERLSLPDSRRAALHEYIWSHAGNVCRARGNLQEAEEAFGRARELTLQALGGVLPNVLERSRLGALEAALARDRGDFPGALAKLGSALSFSSDPAPTRAALLLEQGRLRRRLGHLDLALDAVSRARELVGSADARLRLRLEIELGFLLCDLGRPAEVRRAPIALRRTASRFPAEQTRLLCLEGRAAAGVGRLLEAAAAFERADAEPRGRATGDVAVLLLEVAALSLREGRAAALPGLAERALRLAEPPLLKPGAAATLKLFSRLATQEKLTADRAAQIAKDFARMASA